MTMATMAAMAPRQILNMMVPRGGPDSLRRQCSPVALGHIKNAKHKALPPSRWRLSKLGPKGLSRCNEAW